MRIRPLELRPLGVIALLGALPSAAAAARWEVTLPIRVEGGTRRQVTVQVALPLPATTRRVSEVDVTERDMAARLEVTDDASWVELRGRVRRSRRVAVTYTLESTPVDVEIPAVVPVVDPEPALLPFIVPAPLFQSRSILVREFLERQVAPALQGEDVDLLRAIYEATRRRIKWRRDGKSLPLDVIRRRRGKRIGIERAFVTFLRCAGIPARFVEGVDLESGTKRKRVFWTEVWADGVWWPVSASRGRMGTLPASWVGLVRDGARVLRVDGPATASYVVHAYPLPDAETPVVVEEVR